MTASEVLDLYLEYMRYDGNDEIENEDLRWDFIDAAVDLLERLSGRSVGDELD